MKTNASIHYIYVGCPGAAPRQLHQISDSGSYATVTTLQKPSDTRSVTISDAHPRSGQHSRWAGITEYHELWNRST